jgi:pSer/pThr/pTyr-binding forkhead associated (FHA) protein
LEVFDKFCPVCKRKNDPEAMVCIHCGTLLDSYPIDEAGITRTTEMPGRDIERMEELLINEAMIPNGSIGLYLAGTSDPVFLSSQSEIIIGRKVGDEETTATFLDLAKWGGYQLGLSKRHAVVRRAENAYELIDLSSRNGTWLNDQQLIPEKPYPLASGSQLRLAKVRLFVLYRSALTAKPKM